MTDLPDNELPKNEKIKLIKGISGVFHTPEIVEGETSSTGKTIEIEIQKDSHNTKTYRLDTEKILSGGSEYRRATSFQLYTPEEYQKQQEMNKQPGPRAGTNSVTEESKLPEPTHQPVEG